MDKTHGDWRGNISCLWQAGKVWLATECKQEHLWWCFCWESQSSHSAGKDNSFSLWIANLRGAVGQDCWAIQETKPLSYFESWSQIHRYGGTFGTLLLDFGKRQMPKLGGEISEVNWVSSWFHQSFEWTFLTEDRCPQSWERREWPADAPTVIGDLSLWPTVLQELQPASFPWDPISKLCQPHVRVTPCPWAVTEPPCSFITPRLKLSCTCLTLHRWTPAVESTPDPAMSVDSLWCIWGGEAAGEWTGLGSGRRDWLGGVHWTSSVAWAGLDVWWRCENCGLAQEIARRHLKSLGQGMGLWRSLSQKHHHWPVRIVEKRHKKRKNGGKMGEVEIVVPRR